MTGLRIDWPHDQGIDSNSDVQAGAKFYVYQNTTTTPITLYSDRAATVTRANPVVADSAGRFDVAYVAADDLLTLALKTSADVPIDSWDDIEPEVSTDLTALANFLPLAGGTMTGALSFKEGAAVASATSINLDASGGNFNHISGTTTIATITLAEGAMRWVVFDGILTLTHSASLILKNSLDIVTVAGDAALFVGEGLGITRLLHYHCIDGRPLIESVDIIVAVGDETTAITTGTGKITFRAPFAFTLNALPRASLTTASSGAAPAFDINNAGASIFTTTLTIDASELTSVDATVPAVLTGTITFADNAPITIDFDTAGTGAAGAKFLLRGYKRNRS